LLRAGWFLEGRKLLGVEVSRRPSVFSFKFEEATLAATPHRGADAHDPIWNLHGRNLRKYLRYEAGGLLHYGPRRKNRTVSVQAADIAL
jgi:hypothetical protein